MMWRINKIKKREERAMVDPKKMAKAQPEQGIE